MPRIARAVAIGYPHHIVQRGNNKEKVFFNKKDKERYLSLLIKYSDTWNCPILAYSLMTNHVHLLVRPKIEESLYKIMQGVILCYTQYINREYGRTGRPYGGEGFITKMENKLDRTFRLGLPGRPRKKAGREKK
ncbi:MAG: transposase [Nitrospirota bacterium]